MIEITDEHIKNGKLDPAALADFGADAVEFEGDNIIFKSKVIFWYCNSLISVDCAIFNGNVVFSRCSNAINTKDKAKQIVAVLEGHNWLEKIAGSKVIKEKTRREVWKIIKEV